MTEVGQLAREPARGMQISRGLQLLEVLEVEGLMWLDWGLLPFCHRETAVESSAETLHCDGTLSQASSSHKASLSR